MAMYVCTETLCGWMVSDHITCSQWERTEHYRSEVGGGSIVAKGKGLSIICRLRWEED